jgi:ATP-dependent DNA helicase DinG
MTEPLEQTQKIFGPDGILSSRLDRFESRPGQLAMAKAVAFALQGGKLVVEAETGIGKTLAYLIPAVLSGQKIVVSTNTLNLQEQILAREIPFIQQHIDPDLTVLCVKGRQNYLCLYRWYQFAARPQQELFAADESHDLLAQWLQSTATGDRAELDWLEDNSPLWREISATTNQCLGNKCPDEKNCFITILRKKAAAARLLIVNHHLMFSDLALRREGLGEVLPRYESVIFDEAHHIEDVATRFFGFSFSHYQLLDLLKDIQQGAEALPDRKREKTLRTAEALYKRAAHFLDFFPAAMGRFPLQEFIDDNADWENEVNKLAGRLAKVGSTLTALSTSGEVWTGLADRCTGLLDTLQAISGVSGDIPPSDTYVRWYERRERTVVLTASPIEVSVELNSILYTRVRSVIFTSGTLSIGGDFSYFIERLGLDRDTDTLSLPSPFNYRDRTLLYVPANNQQNQFLQPDQEGYFLMARERIRDLLMASNGRALVLFTSLHAMKRAHAYLVESIPYPVLVQGEAPRNILLETFQQQTFSVLLAVASFWEGINVPGESLSCLIIDKLPFEVPSDPVIMARIEKVRQEGGNPFMDFQVPRATLALRQGIGRLMRASTDKGLLAILDIRLFTKRYGRLFLESLPPSPVTRSMEEVKLFFNDEAEQSDITQKEMSSGQN